MKCGVDIIWDRCHFSGREVTNSVIGFKVYSGKACFIDSDREVDKDQGPYRVSAIYDATDLKPKFAPIKASYCPTEGRLFGPEATTSLFIRQLPDDL